MQIEMPNERRERKTTTTTAATATSMPDTKLNSAEFPRYVLIDLESEAMALALLPVYVCDTVETIQTHFYVGLRCCCAYFSV